MKDIVSQSMQETEYPRPYEMHIVHWSNIIADARGHVSSPVSMRALCHRLAYGQRLPDIKKDIPGISMKSLIHARAYFTSQYPDLYRPHFDTNSRILVDENVDPHFTTDYLRRMFGQADHVTFIPCENIKTQSDGSVKDLEVWKYALKHKYNFLVTKDCKDVKGRKHIDLTRAILATYRMKLQISGGVLTDEIIGMPKEIQIKDADISYHELKEVFNRHHDAINEIDEENVSPIIELRRGSVRPGRTMIEVMRGKKDPKLERIISLHARRILENFDTNQLMPHRVKSVHKSIRNRVEHDMMGDFAKIPFSGKREEKLQEYIKRRLAYEERFAEAIKCRQRSSYKKWEAHVAPIVSAQSMSSPSLT